MSRLLNTISFSEFHELQFIILQTQPPNYSTSPQQQQYQPQPTQAFRPVAASAQPPPPSTIQLRQEVPVTQQPNPVFPSQPATATLQGEQDRTSWFGI